MKSYGKFSVIFCILVLSTGLFARRWYDPQIARWTTPDPADEFHSPYVYVGNAPIIAIDPDGSETYINIFGEINTNYRILDPQDPSVFLIHENGKWSKVGELGGEIDISIIFDNLLDRNYKAAQSMWNPSNFYENVDYGGIWDYKSNQNTIYGLANTYKQETWFVYWNEEMRTDAPGNIHYGLVGLAFGDNVPGIFFPESFLSYMAGFAQINGPYGSESGWIKGKPISIGGYQFPPFRSPYADDPRDQYYINKGFKQYWWRRASE